MGRAFEFRKARKMKRWSSMAKVFTRIGKDIVMAVKSGGPDPSTNSRLRAVIQNSKAANMPKANIDNAIKKATAKDSENYEEVIYEGYAPHGIAVLVETATDNPTRTVANIRVYFSKNDGSMGNSGSVAFMFERKGVFRFEPAQLNVDEMELDLIDAGAEDIQRDEEEITIYTKFSEFGHMLKFLETKNLNAKSSLLQYIPTTTKELTEAEQDDVLKCVEALEQDDDVQSVYHNLA